MDWPNKHKAVWHTVWVSNGFKILLPPGVSFHGRQLQRVQQGLVGECVTLSYVYVPMDMLAAWKYLRGKQVEDEEFSLSMGELRRIEGLQHLELRANFNGSLAQFRVTLPAALQTLTFGSGFNQTLDVPLPAGLQALTLFRQKFQPQLGWRNSARRSASLDF